MQNRLAGRKRDHDDDERGECFRKYADPADSYKDHSDFLKDRKHYAFLFTLDPMDYEGWAWGLKKAGYATNPKYPQILIKLINDYNCRIIP
jgi:flagellum-specific peptidoglycan hydrolase FlgJ